MNASRRFEGTVTVLVIGLVLAFAGLFIHRSKEFSDAAHNEKTTTAYDVRMHSHSNFAFLPSCEYRYSVGEANYRGNGECPKSVADDSINDRSVFRLSVSSIPNATVFYNSADPSVSSLVEFGEKGRRFHRNAVIGVVVGVIPFALLLMGPLPGAIKGKRKVRIAADVEWGEVYSGEPDSGPPSGAPFDRNGSFRRSDGAASDRGENWDGFAHSPELRNLYLEVVRQVHPDRALNESDRGLRERLMKDANDAFSRHDVQQLHKIFAEYRNRSSGL